MEESKKDAEEKEVTWTDLGYRNPGGVMINSRRVFGPTEEEQKMLETTTKNSEFASRKLKNWV